MAEGKHRAPDAAEVARRLRAYARLCVLVENHRNGGGGYGQSEFEVGHESGQTSMIDTVDEILKEP